MADDLSIFRETRVALTARRRELLDALEKTEAAIAALDDLLDETGAARVSEGLVRKGRASGVKPAVINVLKAAHGNAVHADQILEGVREQGVQVSAVDPKATIVTALIRMARERQAHGGGEGVERLGGNRYRWATGPDRHLGEIWPTAPEPPSELSPDAAQESASERGPSRP